MQRINWIIVKIKPAIAKAYAMLFLLLLLNFSLSSILKILEILDKLYLLKAL